MQKESVLWVVCAYKSPGESWFSSGWVLKFGIYNKFPRDTSAAGFWIALVSCKGLDHACSTLPRTGALFKGVTARSDYDEGIQCHMKQQKEDCVLNMEKC